LYVGAAHARDDKNWEPMAVAGRGAEWWSTLAPLHPPAVIPRWGAALLASLWLPHPAVAGSGGLLPAPPWGTTNKP